MSVVVLAGGKGERLWPLSRKDYPKQFLKIKGKSFFQKTIERCLKLTKPENIFVSTGWDYFFHVKKELEGFNIGEKNIIVEPIPKNTAPAIFLCARWMKDILNIDENETLFVCPSDHFIKREDRFTEIVEKVSNIASNYIVTFGINPTSPETGYGYLKKGESVNRLERECRESVFKVEEFTEKPSEQKAKEYLRNGKYLWNSGMFAFSIKTIMETFKTYAPDIYEPLEDVDLKNKKLLKEALTNVPSISIDYAIMEKADNVVTIPLDIEWSDIGSWQAFYELYEKDKEGNVVIGDILTKDVKNSLIIGDKRLIACAGLENLLVVGTDDAVLVTSKEKAQKVKNIVGTLNKNGRKEALEHKTAYRPWGEYTVLDTGERFRIKRITVNPKESLSLQMHHHRTEHWVVIKGMAKIRIGDKELFIHEGESTFVPKSTLHKLENPGKIPLEIIEVQNGEYVEEDDIIRFEDRYGRNKVTDI
jgi:mannose-1-phosphate guanylyltransferase/mannose-6-phosphate isomerase